MLRVSPKSVETQLLNLPALHPPHQAPLSMGFSRQEYWSGLPFLSLKDLLDSGMKPQVSCIAGKFFRVWATRETHVIYRKHLYSRNNWQTHCFFIGSDVCHFLLQVLNMISPPMKPEMYLCDCWKVHWVSNWFGTIVLDHMKHQFSLSFALNHNHHSQWEIHTLGAIRNWWMV